MGLLPQGGESGRLKRQQSTKRGWFEGFLHRSNATNLRTEYKNSVVNRSQHLEGAKRPSRRTVANARHGETALETPDGQITKFGLAVLNAALKSFLEQAYNLTTERKNGQNSKGSLSFPGYLILSNELENSKNGPKSRKTLRNMDVHKVNIFPPMNVHLESGERGAQSMKGWAEVSPEFNRSRPDFGAWSNPTSAVRKSKPVSKVDFGVDDSTDIREPHYVKNPTRTATLGKRGKSSESSNLHTMKNILNPLRLLNDMKTKAASSSGIVGMVKSKAAKHLLSETKRKKRSDADVALDFRELLNLIRKAAKNSKIQIEDSEEESTESQLAAPENSSPETTTQANREKLKINRYHCHKFQPPCAKSMVESLGHQNEDHRSDDPDAGLVNFLLMLHNNNTQTEEDDEDDDGDEEDIDLSGVDIPRLWLYPASSPSSCDCRKLKNADAATANEINAITVHANESVLDRVAKQFQHGKIYIEKAKSKTKSPERGFVAHFSPECNVCSMSRSTTKRTVACSLEEPKCSHCCITKASTPRYDSSCVHCHQCCTTSPRCSCSTPKCSHGMSEQHKYKGTGGVRGKNAKLIDPNDLSTRRPKKRLKITAMYSPERLNYNAQQRAPQKNKALTLFKYPVLSKKRSHTSDVVIKPSGKNLHGPTADSVPFKLVPLDQNMKPLDLNYSGPAEGQIRLPQAKIRLVNPVDSNTFQKWLNGELDIKYLLDGNGGQEKNYDQEMLDLETEEP